MKIQFNKNTGVDVRVITKPQWAALDIEQDLVRWDAENDFTADVSEQAGAWLLENDSDFKRASDEEKKPAGPASPLTSQPQSPSTPPSSTR